MGVERWPVNRLIACAAGPGGVAAAVPEAGLMTDQHLIRAERVSARASRRWMGGSTLSGSSLQQLAECHRRLAH